MNLTSLSRIAVPAAIVLFVLSGCKKSSSPPGFPISATVNGNGFTPATVEAIGSLGNIHIRAYGLAGADSSTLYVQFDDSCSLNRPIDISGRGNTEVVWTNRKAIYDSWSYGSHGTLILTHLDKVYKKITGQFTGVIYAFALRDSVVILNGKIDASFRTQ